MSDNIFTMLIEIGGVLLIVALVVIVALPYILSFITPYLTLLPIIMIFGFVALVFVGMYLLNGFIKKMHDGL